MVQKLDRDHPRRVWDDLVDPAAMPQRLGALGVRHDRLALLLLRQLVVADADQKINVRERLLGLLDGSRVAKVEEIVDLCFFS